MEVNSHSEKVNDPLPGDSASYDAEWKRAWAGVRLQYSYGANVFALRAQYHDYDYDGVGNWKLIDTLKHPKSFTHAADGDGYKLSANYAREFASSWDFIASLHYTNFESDSGKEKNFLTDGSVVAQTFNGADWESYSLNIGVTYKF